MPELMTAKSNKQFLSSFSSNLPQVLSFSFSSDLETPVSAYLKLCGESSYSFLFESVEGGEKLGRYSIIGMEPDLFWRCSRGQVEIRTDGGWVKSDIAPLDSLRETIAASVIPEFPAELPPMCSFGLFGYVGYDMIRLVEKIPDDNPDELDIPESLLIRPTVLAIFDNVKHKICLVTSVFEHAGNSKRGAEKVYHEARSRLQRVHEKLIQPLDKKLLMHRSVLDTPLPVHSNFEAEDYRSAVRQAIEYINAGEVFQVVPSQRFTAPFDLPAFELYRSLRSLNPSPFLFHLQLEDFVLVGSSPEILVRVRDDTVTIRPIAGTRKRGETPEEDKALAEDLLADPKERAEHLMLLDLGRNDVGRVAEIGSVKVTEQFVVELYSHVMHIVSNVEGKLRSDLDIVDALFAGFPAGTVSGAPKIRAMEIIDALEPTRRGFYAGGVGYFSGKTLDTCIALRTALVKDGKVYVQAGGGVVADSDPESENQECHNKARAIIRAAELAIEKFKG
jgi:anthranilate synthase component 1